MKPFYILLAAMLGLAATPAAQAGAFPAPRNDALARTRPKAVQPMLRTSTDRMTIATLENYIVTNTFQLWNGSESPQGKMIYLITESISWLTVAPGSGFVSNATQTVSVIFSAGSMPTGTYTGAITVDARDSQTGNPALGAPKTISVTLTIGTRHPLCFEKPQVRGIPFIGQTLTAWRGLWQSANRLVFAYEWQMANDRNGGGLTNITDAGGDAVTSTNCVLLSGTRSKYLRVKVTATDFYPWPLSTTVYSDFTDARRVKAAPEDFDGDGLTDLWLYYPPAKIWKVACHSNVEATAVFGTYAGIGVPQDFDGDGIVDPAVYDAATGLWSAMLSAAGYAVASARFGGAGYEPVTGDYDGDGKADPATYNESAGRWSALLSGSVYQPVSWEIGGAGYEPAAGDYDGDGKADPAVYQSATGLWLVMLSGSGYAVAGTSFGGAGYLPAPGDYDGDGKTDISVYWPAGNWWWAKSSQTGSTLNGTFGPSNGRGVPVPGYHDHDALCDPAVIYLANDFLVWCILTSGEGYRGQSFQFSNQRWRVSW